MWSRLIRMFCMRMYTAELFGWRPIQWRSNGVGRVGKVQGAPSGGAPEFQAKIKINKFPVTVKIRTSKYQT